MKKILFILFIFFLFGCVTKNNTNTFFEIDIKEITNLILDKVPYDSNILIQDFVDLNGITSEFGKYITERIYVDLSQTNINLVDRNSIELILKEQELHSTGLIDQNTSIKIGELVGANILIKGTVTEFRNTVEIEITILNISNGTIIGGGTHQIVKTEEVALLISNIIKTEEQIQNELEEYRQTILHNIEEEKNRRLSLLESRENDLLKEIDILEEDIIKKSIIISDYEEKMKIAQDLDNYIKELHSKIDQLNTDIVHKLKIGMSLSSVKDILKTDNIHKADFSGYDIYVSGRYILFFEGDTLIKGVKLGSSSGSSVNIVTDISSAIAYGQNCITY